MRITEVNIPRETQDNGIESFRMSRLDKIVFLAGKNGAGKSRILKKISTLVQNRRPEDYDKISRQIIHIESEIYKTQQNLTAKKNHATPLIDQVEKAEDQKENILALEKQVAWQKQEWTSLLKQKNVWDMIITQPNHQKVEIIQFVPKNLNLKDCYDFSKKKIELSATNIFKNIGLQHLPEGTFATIQWIQDQYFNATHPDTLAQDSEKDVLIEKYLELQKYIRIFLSTDLHRNTDGNATLFGRRLGETALSDGQKVLLMFCITLYVQGIKLSDAVLMMDEPENHLHPSAVIEVLDKILDNIPNGQVWIATHSIPLLAHYDPKYIWYVENGRVSYAGKTPEKVLTSLLGNEEERVKLHDFLNLPATLALNRFSYECLFAPEAVITSSGDPQTKQIWEAISRVPQPVKILDYGAGKGRMLANLLEDLDEEGKKKAIEQWNYVAFDQYDCDRDECRSVINQLYGTYENRYFNDYEILTNNRDRESFDIIVMCNVLHEINPAKWLELFQFSGKLSSLLKSDGHLLIVEDTLMPNGEKAHQHGFLVLDTSQIKALFAITENDKDFLVSDARGDGRLKAYLIPKRLVTNISAMSRKQALEGISSKATRQITELRAKEASYKNGQLLGFWLQQFANSQLVLGEIG